MIYLTKKDAEKSRFVLNHKLIERMEGVTDTILLLENGKRILVDETKEEVIEKIREYEAKIVHFQFVN